MSIVSTNTASAGIETHLPIVNTEVFGAQTEPGFWLGKTAIGAFKLLPEEYEAAGRLRANVYIDEEGFLPEAARRSDHTERDDDDNRSIHFAVIERNIGSLSTGKLVGTSRLIHKHVGQKPLPIESFFPEVFDEDPAPAGSFEASRYIARYPKRKVQGTIALSLIRAMVLEGKQQEAPYVYATVEKKLMRLFEMIGLPLTQLAEPKALDEYDSTLNVPLRFEPEAILKTAAEDTGEGFIMTPFFNRVGNLNGQGHYDASFMSQSPPEIVEVSL